MGVLKSYNHMCIFSKNRNTISTIKETISTWKEWQELNEDGDFNDLEASPDNGVRECWWHSGWLPMASNGLGDLLCFDFSPAKGGNRGQVITVWHERSDRVIAFPSPRHLLAELVTDWRQ